MNRKVERLQKEISPLQTKIDEGTASGREKQEFIRLAAKQEAYQDVLDMVNVLATA